MHYFSLPDREAGDLLPILRCEAMAPYALGKERARAEAIVAAITGPSHVYVPDDLNAWINSLSEAEVR